MGNTVDVPFPPQRIISLVPSQTELLHDLRIDERVVGITKFCERPIEWQLAKTKVGGTKSINMEKIVELQPDIIIGNKEENDKQSIELLQKRYPVWMSDINTLEDAIAMILAVGEIAERGRESKTMVETIRDEFAKVIKTEGTVLYLIWNEPWMGVGANTFIHSILSLIGYKNVLNSIERYPKLTMDKIKSLNPDYIFLSSEPYPFREKHMEELKLHLPEARIRLVDGQFFSWYGSRLMKAPAYFNQLQVL